MVLHIFRVSGDWVYVPSYRCSSGFMGDTLASNMNKINAEVFHKAMGREPTHDDLERCNCQSAGDIGHLACGWDTDLNKPNFDLINVTKLKPTEE